jgi:Domain of unknown function (DUF4397)
VIDAGKLNLFVDTKQQNALESPLDFKGVFPTSGYSGFAPKKYSFEATPPGSSKAALMFDATFESAKTYTVVVMGAVATKVPARPLTSVVFEDDNKAPATGSFKIRVIHAATDSTAATLNTYITVPGPNLGIPLTLDYGKASVYVELPAGTFQIRVTPSTDNKQILRDLPSFLFEAGKVYTVVVPDGALGSNLPVFVDRNP